MKTQKNTIVSDARRALSYRAKDRVRGGYKLTHEPSCYGVAIKWLIGMKRLTYAQFGDRFNGTTGQNINKYINRVGQDRFFEEDIGKICEVLGVSVEYFENLVKNIKILMEK